MLLIERLIFSPPESMNIGETSLRLVTRLEMLDYFLQLSLHTTTHLQYLYICLSIQQHNFNTYTAFSPYNNTPSIPVQHRLHTTQLQTCTALSPYNTPPVLYSSLSIQYTFNTCTTFFLYNTPSVAVQLSLHSTILLQYLYSSLSIQHTFGICIAPFMELRWISSIHTFFTVLTLIKLYSVFSYSVPTQVL